MEQILVRLDDKITRLANRQTDEDEDVLDDLIGYLVLLKIAREIETYIDFDEFIREIDKKLNPVT